MRKLDKIFIVIDPATNNQYALTQAAEIAKRREAEIVAHLCIFSGLETNNGAELKEAELSRYTPWLENHLQPVRKQGIKVKTEIAWDEDWQEEVANAAKKEKPDLIIKTSQRNPKAKRLHMLSSDWMLFEKAMCSILLVNSEMNRTGKILMAIDINRKDKKYQDLLESVIKRGKSIANARKAELHVVNAYVDQDDYVHVTDVAKRVDIPSKQVHVVGAQPEQAIAQVAKKVNAEMVIMGISTKSRLASRIFGYTSEWLLNNLTQDVYVIIPKKN